VKLGVASWNWPGGKALSSVLGGLALNGIIIGAYDESLELSPGASDEPIEVPPKKDRKGFLLPDSFCGI
jgi:hypothetical protein